MLDAPVTAADLEGDAEPLHQRINDTDRHIAPLMLNATKTPAVPTADTTGAVDRELAADALRALRVLLAYFANGKHWTHGLYIRRKDGHARRCLVAAMDHLESPFIDTGAVSIYLQRGLPGWALGDLIVYNDHCRSFKQFRSLIDDAHELAYHDASPPPASRMPLAAVPACISRLESRACTARRRCLRPSLRRSRRKCRISP